MSYFLDTYAIIEIANGNPEYIKYLKEKLFTSLYNLYELYFNLLKNYDEDIARKIFYQFKANVIQIRDEHIFKASKFKLNNIKKGLSYVDCLGYIMSLEYKLKFLTGDKEFENLKNVEFVKK